MYQLITDKNKIKELHSKFSTKIIDLCDIEEWCKLFVHHDSISSPVLFSSKYKIWAGIYDEPVEDTRYWNPFGYLLRAPRKDQTLAIVVEINYPIEGTNWTVAGFWAQNTQTKQHHLFHQGKIGGGAKGVNQEGFFKFWQKEPIIINFNNNQITCAEVCILEGSDFGDKIAYFVNSVRKIKQQIKDPTIKFG